MNQDLVWINYDKLQYLYASDFSEPTNMMGYSNSRRRNVNALYTLLGGRWKGDRVILLGDKWTDEESNPLVKDLRSRYSSDEYLGNVWHAALNEFENMAKYFQEASRNAVIFGLENPNRKRDTVYEEHKNDPDYFFKDKTIYYRYVINHTKKEFYRRKSLKDRNNWFNTLSYLLISAEEFYGGCYGMWIGDSLEVTNDKKLVENLDYKDVTMIYTRPYFLGSYDKEQEEKRREASKMETYKNLRELLLKSNDEDKRSLVDFLDRELNFKKEDSESE